MSLIIIDQQTSWNVDTVLNDGMEFLKNKAEVFNNCCVKYNIIKERASSELTKPFYNNIKQLAKENLAEIQKLNDKTLEIIAKDNLFSNNLEQTKQLLKIINVAEKSLDYFKIIDNKFVYNVIRSRKEEDTNPKILWMGYSFMTLTVCSLAANAFKWLNQETFEMLKSEMSPINDLALERYVFKGAILISGLSLIVACTSMIYDWYIVADRAKNLSEALAIPIEYPHSY